MVADGVCGIRTCAWLILYSHLSGARVKIGTDFPIKEEFGFYMVKPFSEGISI